MLLSVEHSSSPLFGPYLLFVSVYAPTIPALRRGLMKTNWFGLKPITLWGLSVCLIPITGFSVNLASNHCVVSLQDSTEHFPSTRTTRAIYTRTLSLHYYHTRFLCSISYAYDSLFSTFPSIFSYSTLGPSPCFPLSSIRSFNGHWGDLEWFTPRRCFCPAGAPS